jgi:hypothetical protein
LATGAPDESVTVPKMALPDWAANENDISNRSREIRVRTWSLFLQGHPQTSLKYLVGVTEKTDLANIV